MLNDNEATLLTKQLPHGEKSKGFVSNLSNHIFGLDCSVRGVDCVLVEPQVWCSGVDGHVDIEPQLI